MQEPKFSFIFGVNKNIMKNLNKWALDLRNLTPAQLMNLRGYLLKNNQSIFVDTEAELLRGKIDILYPILAFYDNDQEWLSYGIKELEDRVEITYEEFLKIFSNEHEVVCDVNDFKSELNELIAKYQQSGISDGDIASVLHVCIIDVELAN